MANVSSSDVLLGMVAVWANLDTAADAVVRSKLAGDDGSASSAGSALNLTGDMGADSAAVDAFTPWRATGDDDSAGSLIAAWTASSGDVRAAAVGCAGDNNTLASITAQYTRGRVG